MFQLWPPLTGWRRGIAIVGLTALGAIGVAVAAFPWIKPDKPGIAALLVLIALLALVRLSPWNGPQRGWWMLILALAALLPFAVVARSFGRIDMLSFFFHLDFGMEGASLAGLENEIAAGVLSTLFILIAALGLNAALGRPRLFLVGIAVGLVLLNPLIRFAAAAALTPPVDSGLERRLADPEPLVPASRPDLVIVYLEGFELRYRDPALFGDAFAALQPYADRALDLTGVRQVEGTGWSLAGVIASQCGVPLLPNGLRFRNNFTAQTDFLSGRTCLSDILTAHGYRAEFVVGGDLGFGGLDHFLQTHGYQGQYGMAEVSAMFPPDEVEAATIGWILDDQMTFDAARLRHAALIASPQPYMLVVQTIGPHGRTSWLSRRCSPDGRGAFSSDITAVVRCTAEDTARFLDDLQAAQPGRPVNIVILSDHLSHYPGEDRGWPQENRRNTLLLISPGTAPGVNDAAGSMLDVYPTLLDWLGLAAPPMRAGLGVSLFSGEPTLAAEFQPDDLNYTFLHDPRLANAVWRAE
jgi:phosphoglycerol transferase